MREITQFENHAVEIWRRPRQRHINLRVRADGGLRVTCGLRVPKRDIFSFIRESDAFIQGCLQQLAEHARKYPAKKFATGESFLYYGEHVPLEIVWSWNPRIRVCYRDGVLEMVAPTTSTPEERRAALFKHFQREGRGVLNNLVEKFSKQMNLYPRTLAIRGQKTRWGSCSARGEVSLNWKLLAAPKEVIDYVVIHELAHLAHLNHSPKFWQLVETHFPDYRATKKWLRAHEAEITVQFQSFKKNEPHNSLK